MLARGVTSVELYRAMLFSLAPFEAVGIMRRPVVPPAAIHNHNAHMFYIVLDSPDTRAELVDFMKKLGVSLVSHYVPLHLSPMGRKYSLPAWSVCYVLKVLPRYWTWCRREPGRRLCGADWSQDCTIAWGCVWACGPGT